MTKITAFILALVIIVYVTIIGPMDYADALNVDAEVKLLRARNLR